MTSLYSTFRTRIFQARTPALLASLGLSVFLSGCGDREQPLPGGEFELANNLDDSPGGASTGGSDATNSGTGTEEAAPQPTQQRFAIRIDLQSNSVDFIKSKTILQTVAFKRRSKENWEQACPKQVSAELLEVVDLQIPQLDFAGVTIKKPVLTSTCDMSSLGEEILLRPSDQTENPQTFLRFVRSRIDRPLVPTLSQ